MGGQYRLLIRERDTLNRTQIELLFKPRLSFESEIVESNGTIRVTDDKVLVVHSQEHCDGIEMTWNFFLVEGHNLDQTLLVLFSNTHDDEGSVPD